MNNIFGLENVLYPSRIRSKVKACDVNYVLYTC